MPIFISRGDETGICERKGGIEPSRAPLASLFSAATFSWVFPIIWSGYKNTVEMDKVGDFPPGDDIATVLAEYRAMERTASLGTESLGAASLGTVLLARNLFLFSRAQLRYQLFMGVLSGILTYGPTLLLRAILQYIEDPGAAPDNVLWL